MRYCNLCETTEKQDLEEALQRMFRCKCCRRDVETRGAITGLGFLVFKVLQKKWGKELVLRRWEDLMVGMINTC